MPEPRNPVASPTKISVEHLRIFYRKTEAIRDVSLGIASNRVTALIGPSGCGKSTFLRALNRMNELIPGCRTEGRILLEGEDIYAAGVDPVIIRSRVGMVFQRSNPFPKSVFDNVAYGLRLRGIRDHAELEERVTAALQACALWDEVKDRLGGSALSLSGGQQQRLCIARAVAVEPELLLMDEPASAIDPIATARIEELIHELKARYTIAIVTHNLQQAARIADAVAFFYLGELVEYDRTEVIFTSPKVQKTEEYVTGRFG